MAPARLHLTLHFLGPLPPERQALLRHLPPVAFEPFTLSIVRSGRFGSVAWVGPAAVPAPLAALHEALAAQLRAWGFV